MTIDEREGCAALLLIACIIALVVGAVVASAHFESAAYNRLTGANTTWWDAVWLDLRVQDTPKAPTPER